MPQIAAQPPIQPAVQPTPQVPVHAMPVQSQILEQEQLIIFYFSYFLFYYHANCFTKYSKNNLQQLSFTHLISGYQQKQ
jgi:hypothetical protein